MLGRLWQRFGHPIDASLEELAGMWNALGPLGFKKRLRSYADLGDLVARWKRDVRDVLIRSHEASRIVWQRPGTSELDDARQPAAGGQLMQLYVVRHGIAVDEGGGMPDSSRPLTEKGRRRFQKTARAFGKLANRLDLILTSPLVRAVQTAEILATAADHRDVGVLEELDPKYGVDAVRAAIAARAGKAATVAIVGHEPQLSALVSAMSGVPQAEIDLKKGAIVRLDLSSIKDGARAEVRWWLKPKGARVKGLPVHKKAKVGQSKPAKAKRPEKKRRKRERRSSTEGREAAAPATAVEGSSAEA